MIVCVDRKDGRPLLIACVTSKEWWAPVKMSSDHQIVDVFRLSFWNHFLPST